MESVLCANDLQVFFDGCMDQSVAIRKQSMQSLSNLLAKYPKEKVLQKVYDRMNNKQSLRMLMLLPPLLCMCRCGWVLCCL